MRFKSCPFEVIERFVPDDGFIADLGCGTGLFTNLMAIKSKMRRIIGIDIDERKIKEAAKSLHNDLNIKFRKEDILSDNSHQLPYKCITILDVLCYFSDNKKRILLKRCYDRLGIDGMLILKDIEAKLHWKFIFTFLQEILMTKIFHFTLAEGLYFRSRSYHTALLKDIGFYVENINLSKGYPYSHILFICRKR